MPESVANSGPDYRAFISYSHQDQAWADWLHKALETYRVPSRLVGKETAAGTIPRRLAPIFRDRDELASATDLGRKVNAALAQSANLIVICSPRSASSRWVNEEVRSFKRLGHSERIFCLIVEGEPNASDLPGREAEECFAPALRFTVDANGNLTDTPTEPIAADARAGKDGKANAKLKLIAGMLDVGFDALKQREQQRRTRRMTAIAALAIIVMLVTSALAIDAVLARRAADVARQAAERRQKQAEDLVDFMLGDLNTKLRQVDRLDILSSVDNKAMAYFKSLPVNDVNATALAQRATALQKIGDVRTDQSRLSDAMDAFQQALQLNKRLVAISPNDPARQNAYGENLLWIGFNYWSQGKLDGAESAFTQAAAALQRAARLMPSDNKVQHNLDDVYNDLGHVAGARGEAESEYDYYIRDLDLCRRMATIHPDDVLWQNALGDAYFNLGGAALERGHLDEAVRSYLENQQLMEKVVARDPKNRQMQDQLVTSAYELGNTLALAGQTRAALNYVNSAVNIAGRLIAFDPSHNDWAEDYANSSRLLGKLLLESGDAGAANATIEASMNTLGKLFTKDPGNAQQRSDFAHAQLEGARLALAQNRTGDAQRLAVQADTTMRKLMVGASPTATFSRIQADIELLLGQLAAQAGDAVAATKYRRRALARMRSPTAHPSDPRNLSLRVDALLAMDDADQAQSTVRTLARMGYRPAGFVARLRSRGIAYPVDPAVNRRIAQLVNPAGIGTSAATSDHP